VTALAIQLNAMLITPFANYAGDAFDAIVV
jgi:hypothetical protein